MKKRIICLVLSLLTVFSICFTANAATPETVSPRWNSTSLVIPDFWFSSTDAVCGISVAAHNPNASISVAIRLKDANGTTIATWGPTGTGTLNWERTHAVPNGTYTMVYSVLVYHESTGSDYITDSITATKR